MSFSNRLKETRLKRDFTQEQLAELIGVSIKTYQKYETGVTIPRIATIRKIVIALETTSDELLEL